jgi:hypothetical protein
MCFACGCPTEDCEEYGERCAKEARRSALEEAAKNLEMHADFLDQTKRFMIDPDYLRERANGLRALLTPEVRK